MCPASRFAASYHMSIKKAIIASPKFEAYEKQDTLIARRKRILPLRGIFRVLFPLSIVRVRGTGGAESLSVRPDAWGWIILLVCVMGVIVEFTMPRAKYPRNYPPVFVFAVTAAYTFNLLFDLYLTRRALGAIKAYG